MSRIGKVPVDLPAKVKVSINGPTVKVEGPLGSLERTFRGVTFEQSAARVTLKPVDESRAARALWGLSRTLLANMVTGVSKGFVRVLEINGVGYRAEVAGTTLTLSLGKSHPVVFPLPEGIKAEVEKQTTLKLIGVDKELLGQTAAKVRSFRPPEPYKGKGVKYQEETIRRKAGKSAK